MGTSIADLGAYVGYLLGRSRRGSTVTSARAR